MVISVTPPEGDLRHNVEEQLTGCVVQAAGNILVLNTGPQNSIGTDFLSEAPVYPVCVLHLKKYRNIYLALDIC